MAWYWWVLVAIVVLAVLGAFASAREGAAQAKAEEAYRALLREEYAADERERAAYSRAAILTLLDLPIVTDAEPGEIQSHDRLSANLWKFLHKPHVRTHIVSGTRRLAFVQELGGRKGKAVVRDIVRTGSDSWRVRTHRANSFEGAIAAAEAKAGLGNADRVVAIVACVACGQKNRIVGQGLTKGNAKCGKCGRALPA